MFILGSVLGFVAGGCLIWFAREPVTVWYKGAEDQIGALNDKIQKLKEKL